jgi:succinate dehydrogenase/fumarate reductase cytochrome b subunit
MVFLAIWIFGSLAIAYILHRKFTVFQKIHGVLILIFLAVIFSVLHNFTSALLDFEEPVFFFLAIFSPPIAFYLGLILIFRAFKRKIRDNPPLKLK